MQILSKAVDFEIKENIAINNTESDSALTSIKKKSSNVACHSYSIV